MSLGYAVGEAGSSGEGVAGRRKDEVRRRDEMWARLDVSVNKHVWHACVTRVSSLSIAGAQSLV